MAEKNEKHYVSDNAQLMAEWDWEKNGDISPQELALGSKKKVWWRCQKGHQWHAAISSRNIGKGCPYCSGRVAIKGENDLQTVNPSLASEWDYEMNKGLTPNDILPNSNKQVWWKCEKGHKWQSSVAGRNKGHNCPYCSGRYALSGENDLQTVNPILAQEWNYEKNNGITPADVLPYSSRKVWWRCKKGHEWQATIVNRSRGNGCPYCSGQKTLQGYNDLQTVNPLLAKEWNYEKNNGLTPAEVTANSGKKIWWLCNKGHEWQSTIVHRNKGQGCPICDSERKTSFPEYALEFYISKCGFDVRHSYNEQGYELDIYIPILKIAIEYDGFWHKYRVEQDLEKNRKCKSDGIVLYRIREGLLPLDDSSVDYVVSRDQKDLPRVIEAVLGKIIGTSVDVNFRRDVIAIENLRELTEKEASISSLNPEIATTWNYERNGKLKPDSFTANSNKIIWWKCSEGHEWQAPINRRNNGFGCPYCSGRYAIKGENDLHTISPALAKEWNHEKNNGLTPLGVKLNSHEKVWWKCSKGHEWQATVAHRSRGRGCPYCAGRYVIKGENDLQTVNPTLSQEWNYEKNDGLTPADVMPSSNKKVWWKCSNNHEWQARIADRNRGRGCPECAKQKRKKN